ncbi:MAG TPA: hypothetical protein VM597_15995 [Gemmataceae bacterium]|nr:hypothetical protein [Gemmataceae bacterium]
MDRARLTDDHIRDLAEVLIQTRPDELTCDEWLDRVGGYAEAVAAGRPVPAGSELVEHHLAICPECREELDALVAALRTTT